MRLIKLFRAIRFKRRMLLFVCMIDSIESKLKANRISEGDRRTFWKNFINDKDYRAQCLKDMEQSDYGI
jgi:hypothetical protein